jgi:hypothetical protein
MKKILSLFSTQNLILILTVPFLIIHIVGAVRFLFVREQTKSYFDHDVDIAFKDFQPILKNVPIAGYITNKPMASENNDGHFLMAQYTLAPTVLALNDPQYEYSIIDCTDKTSIMYALQQTQSTPIALNPYGKILAVKKF